VEDRDQECQGRPRFRADSLPIREALSSQGVPEFPVQASHVIALSRLPAFADHRDPFDRLHRGPKARPLR